MADSEAIIVQVGKKNHVKRDKIMESFSIFFSSLDTISLPLGYTLLPCLLKSVKGLKFRSVIQTKVQLLFIFLTQIITKFENIKKIIKFFQFKQSSKKMILKKIQPIFIILIRVNFSFSKTL